MYDTLCVASEMQRSLKFHRFPFAISPHWRTNKVQHMCCFCWLPSKATIISHHTIMFCF